jgi:hypothetical protein
MDNSEDIIRRGAEAERLLNHELLKESFEKVATHITNAWATTSPLEVEAREKLYLKLQVLQEVREHLRIAAENGKFTKSRLEKLSEFTSRVAGYRFGR